MFKKMKAALDGVVFKAVLKSGVKRFLGSYGDLVYTLVMGMIDFYKGKRKVGKKDVSELVEKTLKQFGIFTATDEEIAACTEAGFEYFMAYHGYHSALKTTDWKITYRSFLKAAKALLSWAESFIPLFEK